MIVFPLGIVVVSGSEVALFNDNNDSKWISLPSYAYDERDEAYFVHAAFAEDGKTRRVWVMWQAGAAILDVGDTEWTYIDTPTRILRKDAAAALLDEDNILICGGEMQQHVVKGCLLFNMKSRTWSDDFPDMQDYRVKHACVHYKGDVVVIGSLGKNSFKCERFDTATATWGPFPSIGLPPAGNIAAVIGDHIYVMAFCSFQIYDGTAWCTSSYNTNVAGPLVLTIPLSGTLICFSHLSKHAWRCDTNTNELSVFTRMPFFALDCVSSF